MCRRLAVTVTWQARRGGLVQTPDNQPFSAAPRFSKRQCRGRLCGPVMAALASASRKGKAPTWISSRHCHQGSCARQWVMGSSSTGVKMPFLACAGRTRRNASAGPSYGAGLAGEVMQSFPLCLAVRALKIAHPPCCVGLAVGRLPRHLTWLQQP